MRFFVIAAVLIGSQTCVSGASWGCCFPDRMQGDIFFVEKKSNFLFAVDYPAGRLATTLDRKSYKIIDIPRNQSYSFDDGGCSFTDDPFATQYQQCFPEDQNVGTYQVGEEGLEISIEAFRLELLRRQFWRTMVHEEGTCFPFTVQITGEDSETSTFVFSNLKSSIDFNEIYSPFTDCQEESDRMKKSNDPSCCLSFARG